MNLKDEKQITKASRNNNSHLVSNSGTTIIHTIFISHSHSCKSPSVDGAEDPSG